jgi:hypothetical protein
MWAPWVSSYCSWLILMTVCQRRALQGAASVFPSWIFSTAVTLNSKRLICLAFKKIQQFLIRFLDFRVAPGLILDVLSGRYHRVILDPKKLPSKLYLQNSSRSLTRRHRSPCSCCKDGGRLLLVSHNGKLVAYAVCPSLQSIKLWGLFLWKSLNKF